MHGVKLLSLYFVKYYQMYRKRGKIIRAQTNIQFSNAITDELSMQNLGRLKSEQTFPLFTHTHLCRISHSAEMSLPSHRRQGDITTINGVEPRTLQKLDQQ